MTGHLSLPLHIAVVSENPSNNHVAPSKLSGLPNTNHRVVHSYSSLVECGVDRQRLVQQAFSDRWQRNPVSTMQQWKKNHL